MSAEEVAVSSRTFAAGDVVISCEPWVWSFQYRFHKERCAQCFKESDCFRACSSCKLYRFCATQCQKMNWKKEHKHECEMLREIQTNIVKHKRALDHDCALAGCSKYGCCTAEILVARLCNKILKGTKDKLAGIPGKRSAVEILDLLPYEYEGDRENDLVQPNPTMRKLCWTAQMESIPGFERLVRKIYYNVLPVKNSWGKVSMEMLGIFSQASHRNMTPVCWDINVTMDLQGRNLVVRATEDITSYTGLRDLRQNELSDSGGIFMRSLMQRRALFRRKYHRPCHCRKCTDEYDAEINPLKCVTSRCMERIPSDDRALEPCPQCGALNHDRLHALKKLMLRNEEMHLRCTPAFSGQMNDLFVELESLDLLHKDAHFRIIGGFGGTVLAQMGRYAEAWDRFSSLVASVRAVYPKYHIARARWLEQAGDLPSLWIDVLIEGERRKFFTEVLSLASEYLLEAQGIYKLIWGEGTKWEKITTERLNFYSLLKRMA